MKAKRVFLTMILIVAWSAMACAADEPASVQDETTQAPSPAPSSPAIDEALPGVLVATVDPFPQGVTWAFRSIWVANHRDESISRIDPATNEIEATIAARDQPARAIAGFGSVWVNNYSGSDGFVTKIDPTTNEAETFATGSENGGAIGAGLGGIWVNHAAEKKIAQIDPASLEVVDTIPHHGDPLIGFGSLWVAEWEGKFLHRLDPQTGEVIASMKPTRAPTFTGDAVGFGTLWVLSGEDPEVVRVDPATNRVAARIPLPARPGAITVTPAGVYLALNSGFLAHSVVQVDPSNNKVVGELPMEEVAPLAGITYGDGSVWVTSFGDGLYRIDPEL